MNPHPNAICEQEEKALFIAPSEQPFDPDAFTPEQKYSARSKTPSLLLSRSHERTHDLPNSAEDAPAGEKRLLATGDLLVGERGSYTIRKKLAGMSGNYLAAQNGKKFVIKTGLDCSARHAPIFTQREIDTLTLLEGENVMPALYDTGQINDRTFLAIPYIPGKDLSDIISDPNTSKNALCYLAPITAKVGKMHNKKLVHRDLKPQNIRIPTLEGILDLGNPYILDAGMAIPEEEAMTETRFCGTPDYASPEQMFDGYADRRSDIYALGITLYELAAGTTPFKGTGWYSQIAGAKTRPITLIDANTTLVRVITTATEPDPDKRYQNTNEMLEDITMKYQTQEGVKP